MKLIFNDFRYYLLINSSFVGLATDDCAAGGKVLDVLQPQGFRIFGSCFHTDGKSVIEDKVKINWNPRVPNKQETRESNTQLLIAEIDMLRQGTFFIGVLQSNIGRLIHYLRYPHYENTYSITPHFQDIGIENVNSFF